MAKNQQKAQAGRKGFEALVHNKFGGNEALAKEYVADLGRISYFSTYPGRDIPSNLASKWSTVIPSLRKYTAGG